MNIRRTKKLTAIGMLCALAYAAAFVYWKWGRENKGMKSIAEW